MVGFSLRKKDDEPKKIGFGGFSLKKKPVNTKLPTKAKQFGKHEEEDVVKEVKIDTFDSEQGGAFNKVQGPHQAKSPLVIENAGNQNWRKIARERFNPSPKQTEQQSTQKLDYGINFIENDSSSSTATPNDGTIPQKLDNFKEDVESRPDTATLEEYEELPVEDFGAAMLRGMGWKDDDDKEESTSKKKEDIPFVKRAPYLGLGAKDDSNGDTSKRIDRSYVPVKKVDRRTGQPVEDRQRERSPNRLNPNYRSRNQ